MVSVKTLLEWDFVTVFRVGFFDMVLDLFGGFLDGDDLFGVAEDRGLDSAFALLLGDRLLDHIIPEFPSRGRDQNEIGEDCRVAVFAGDPLEAVFIELGDINA